MNEEIKNSAPPSCQNEGNEPQVAVNDLLPKVPLSEMTISGLIQIVASWKSLINGVAMPTDQKSPSSGE